MKLFQAWEVEYISKNNKLPLERPIFWTAIHTGRAEIREDGVLYFASKNGDPLIQPENTKQVPASIGGNEHTHFYDYQFNG